MKYLPLILFVAIGTGCNSPVDGSDSERIILTTDKDEYYFSTTSNRDFISLAVFNNTDSTISSFGIPTPCVLSDSGWALLYIACGGYNVILPPRQTIRLPIAIMTDSTHDYPEGTYRMQLEMSVEGGLRDHYRIKTSNEFRMRYR